MSMTPETNTNTQRKIEQVAGFGPPPSNIFGVLGYALTVLSRQKKLREKIADLNERLSKAEAARDGAEAQLGQSALDYGLVPDIAEDLKAKVSQAEKSLSAAKGLSNQQSQQHQSELSRVDSEINRIRTELAPIERRESLIGNEMKIAEVAHGQASSAAQQLENSYKTAHSAPASPVPIDPATDQMKANLLRSQADARIASEQLVKLRKESANLRSERARLTKQLDVLEDQRLDLLDEFEEVMDTHSEKAQLASAWRRSQLAIAGRKLYEKQPRPKLLDGERLFGRIEQSRKKVETFQEQLDLYIQALDSFDQKALNQAKLLALALGGLLFVLILLISC